MKAFIKIQDEKILLRTGYHQTLSDLFKSLEGKYDSDSCYWILPLTEKNNLIDKLVELNLVVEECTELPETYKKKKKALYKMNEEKQNFEIFASFSTKVKKNLF
jgi:hypothetical protein